MLFIDVSSFNIHVYTDVKCNYNPDVYLCKIRYKIIVTTDTFVKKEGW